MLSGQLELVCNIGPWPALDPKAQSGSGSVITPNMISFFADEVGMKSQKPPASVAIVGGGVVGTMAAYYLNRAGCAVTVLDKGMIGGGCSHGNCGYICPSHVLPLAVPGALTILCTIGFSQ